MARYLVVELDDNAAADRMRAQIDAATEAGKGMRVAGMFAVPMTWCPCPRPEGYHKGEVVRGSKLGWWVHKICRRARFGTHDLVNLIKPAERQYREDADYIEIISSVNIFEMKRIKAENPPS